MTAREFIDALLAQGIELVCHRNGGRLSIWPGRAYRYLTDAEREYIRANRAELKALVLAEPRETTVVWQPGAGLPREVAANACGQKQQPTVVLAPDCPYCRRSCVGESHWAFPILHLTDPKEVMRRNKAEMEALDWARRFMGGVGR
jgi:hypothetical protein